jgi:polar amino acid transport system substrate-binding protein
MKKTFGLPMVAMALAILGFLGFSDPASAEEINVGLEPFPPLIVDADSGYTITLLEELEKASDFTFNIQILSYSRAKAELKSGRTDLIAHTPHGLETEDFYAYAQELDWKFPTVTDVYGMDPERLANLRGQTIGIPRGNEGFFSEISGVPAENLYSGELKNLLRMLEKGRIDAFWFERASTMTQLYELGIEGVHYRQMPETPISSGMAVARTPAGDRLKARLDALLKNPDFAQIYAPYRTYLSIPPQGRFSLDE